ncbi:MAG TPA: T9SS type A sorting domain-containing protein [Bacteroidia bacterium]|nr:T9SS type A sorting domain-containing protein [Bacteroidia bacterium]
MPHLKYTNMLRNTLVALLLYTGLASAQSTVYHPFPDSNVVWRQDCGGLGFFCNCSCSNGVCVNKEDRQYYYGNDTVIGSFTYHKLIVDNFNVDYWQGPIMCSPGCVPSDHYYSYTANYAGAIRNDSAQKKVYYYEQGSAGEVVLYDFNLNLGDTLPITYTNVVALNRVNKIDSVLVGTVYHRRFWLNDISMPPPGPQDSGFVALIEGIGSTYGLLTPLLIPFEFECHLACVTVDSTTVYPDASTSCSFITTGIASAPPEIQLSIYPNPVTSESAVEWPLTKGPLSLQLVNSLGQVLLTTDVTGRTSYTLSREGLPGGIYLLQLRGPSAGSAVQRICIGQ